MSTLTGTGRLVRLILRRDRVLLPLWVLFIGVVPVSYVGSINGLFPTAVGRQHYADASAHNAGFVALYGRLFGSSLGELVTWRAGFIPIMIGLFTLLTVIRHTRTEEDTGRRELLAATALGRHANLAAAMLTTMGANLVLAVIVALGMISQDLPASGSWAFGIQLAATGWVFTGIAGIAAQLTSGAGSARGIAVTALAAAYVFRVVGDVSGMTDGPLAWVSWLSPVGWAQRIRPYGDQRWWPVALLVAVTLLLAL
ncbi:MAG: ABC transporter permease, partial [Actinocatenispora sp.]